MVLNSFFCWRIWYSNDVSNCWFYLKSIIIIWYGMQTCFPVESKWKVTPDEIKLRMRCDGDASEVVLDDERFLVALSEVIKLLCALPMLCGWYLRNASFVASSEPGERSYCVILLTNIEVLVGERDDFNNSFKLRCASDCWGSWSKWRDVLNGPRWVGEMRFSESRPFVWLSADWFPWLAAVAWGSLSIES